MRETREPQTSVTRTAIGVDGLRFPRRIRRVARGVTFEEIRLKQVVVNPPLTAKHFERP